MHQVWEATCLACEEVISNPVCPDCLAQEIADAVANRELASAIMETAGAIRPAGNELTKCVLCGKRISVCPYCFLKDTKEMLCDSHPHLQVVFAEQFCYPSDSF
jgi:hypothetical protein